MVRGRGVLVCADKEIPASYSLELSNDDWGAWIAKGFLNNVEREFAIEASQSDSICYLRLQDSQEIAVHISPLDDGSILVQSSGPIPDI